ncbi:hypothetical protein GGQ88_002070 [Novosphingobium hassiacum]|uniref:Uncharacterized protein n=1 Tax=Novosphingobium hassiacum TaxID=173676 RepID=A0A7W5ZWH6_9SPHN|nr:hypothetical protein [Novosphingobium hassiacum]MBB3860801.1 hypothetical protein [Novosphingobium hassiacum]
MPNALERFLSRNTVEQAAEMPVFHTTRAYYAKKILIEGAIKPRRCEVFRGEDLTYLFYGRPSYKMPEDMAIAKYWQLPSVFIFESDVVDYKRIFPFDTGAFKGGLYPQFFGMMPLSEYELNGNQDYPRKIVSAFFATTEKFFKLKPRKLNEFEEEFEVTATDEEIKALYDLIEHNDGKVDDRRFSIELQTENEVLMSSGKCKAIIIPEEYLENTELIEKVESQGIEVMSYPSLPLKQEMYYYAIYNVVYELYKGWGLAR